MNELLKAYEDVDFLKRPECRPIRLQLELLRPDLVMEEHGIRSTIVVFGSSRVMSPQEAEQQVKELEKKLSQSPASPALKKQLLHAQKRLEQSAYYETARQFTELICEQCQRDDEEWKDYVVVTGGGGGIMEAGNRGAWESGAKSAGLNISLPYEQEPNEYTTEELKFEFHYFSIRKMHFLLRARALCAFPGGLGTLDELFETLTLIQTNKIEPMPVVLFGKEFWDRLVDWNLLVEEGLIDREDLDIFRYVETPQEAWDYIRSFWQQTAEPVPSQQKGSAGFRGD